MSLVVYFFGIQCSN